MSLHEEAQYLADKASNIADKIKAKKIPATAIAQDISTLLWDIVKLREDVLKNDDL